MNLNRLSAALLKKGIWPWTTGVEARFPDHFKLRYLERWTKPPIPVHIVPDPDHFVYEPTGEVKRNQNADVPIIRCEEQEKGLWGGEGIIKGFVKKHYKKRRVPKIWRPFLIQRVLYSEILDRYMDITVTHRTLQLIDDCQGFDNYILGTHEVDLKSALGMQLKREMLTTLAEKSMYEDDPQKQSEIYQKYKQFDMLPREEIEWLGLSLKEAREKQKEMEMAKAEAAVQPLKNIYAQDLISRLKTLEAGSSETKQSGIISRLLGRSDAESKEKQ